MPRDYNTDTNGKPFTDDIIDKVWEKARIDKDLNPEAIRRDFCGAFIFKLDYGETTQHGWEIDHIKPVSKNGTDDLDNLQSLQWENNRHKADNYPNWKCKKKI